MKTQKLLILLVVIFGVIIIPSITAQITSISSDCFNSGSPATIKLIFKAQDRGSIDFFGQCTSGFDVTRKSISFNAGEEKIVYLDLTGSTNEIKLNGVCTIKANNIETIDSKEVEVCVKGLTSCNAGTEWCEDGNRWKCTDGIKQEIIENCKSKNLICSDSGRNTICEKEPWISTSMTSNIIIISFLIIVIVLIVLLIYFQLKKKK